MEDRKRRYLICRGNNNQRHLRKKKEVARLQNSTSQHARKSKTIFPSGEKKLRDRVDDEACVSGYSLTNGVHRPKEERESFASLFSRVERKVLHKVCKEV